MVRAGDASPAVTARIYWLTPASEAEDRRGEGRLEFARRAGESSGVDERGEAQLDVPWNRFRACAVTEDGWYGEVDEPSGFQRPIQSGAVVVTVRPPADLRVRIQDSTGEPVPHAGLCVFQDGQPYPIRRERADRLGAVEITRIQTWIGGDAFTIQAVAFGGAGERRRVSLRELRESAEPVVLQLEAGGEIVVRVLPSDAERAGEVITSLTPRLKRVDLPADSPRIFDPLGFAGDRYGSDGVARIRPVAVGGRFEVDARFARLRAEIDGPRTAGAVSNVDLRADWSEVATARCRVVDEAGQPVAGVRATVRIRRGEDRAATDSFYGVEFEGSGAARFVLGEGEAVEATIEIEADLDGVPMLGEAGPVTGLVLDERTGAVSGDIDFRDVVLRPLPVLVSGRALYADGEPLPDRVDLVLERERGTGPEDERVRIFAAALGDDEGWEGVSAELRWTDGARFAFYGTADDSARLRIVAPDPLLVRGDLDRGLSVRPGDDVDLRITFGGVLRALFRVDDSTPWEQTAFQIARVADADGSRFGRPRVRSGKARRVDDPDGALSEVVWSGLSPGSYSLRVCGSQVEPLFEFPGLQVGFDGVITGLWTEPVDLRGRLRSLAIDFVGDGGPIAVGALYARRSGTTSPFVYVAGGSSSIPFVDPLDIRASVSGYEAVSLSGVEASTSVQLRAMERVRIALDEGETSRPERLTLLVESTGTRFEVGGFHFRNIFGVAPIDPGFADRVSRTVELDRGRTTAETTLPVTGLPWTIDVTEPSGLRVTPVTLDALPPDGTWRIATTR
ncbi:MAG: hypothetical protein AAGB93_02575 [Planctomycetota bacterium]